MTAERPWIRVAGTAALVGAAGVGLHRLVRRWEKTYDRPAVGYVSGKPIALRVVKIDGKPVEVATAAAFGRMRETAARDGVRLQVVSGFRTIEEQTRLHQCYVTCSCNNCNYAEAPGFSQHQSGRALDLNARAGGVFAWLSAHAAEHGFYNTVASEPWHWEFWPGSSERVTGTRAG